MNLQITIMTHANYLLITHSYVPLSEWVVYLIYLVKSTDAPFVGGVVPDPNRKTWWSFFYTLRGFLGGLFIFWNIIPSFSLFQLDFEIFKTIASFIKNLFRTNLRNRQTNVPRPVPSWIMSLYRIIKLHQNEFHP